jgi:hypothetical protein
VDRGGDYNRVYGLDANLRLFGNLDWSSYAVATDTPERTRGEYAWRSSGSWEGNFFHGKAGIMSIGEGFQSDLSYYRRTATRKWFTDIGIRPRPLALQRRGIREMHPHIVASYYTDLDGRISAKRIHAGYTFFFNNGGYAEYVWNPEFQRLTRPLSLAPGVPPLPPGGYAWTQHELRSSSDPSRAVSLGLNLFGGGLWSGTQKTIQPTLTLRPSYKVRVTIGLQRTAADLAEPVGRFVTTFWTLRTNYSFSTNMFIDSLVQYLQDRDELNVNVRFNLIHRPLSDIYVVWNEQRFTTDGAPSAGRGLILKYTHMLAF